MQGTLDSHVNNLSELYDCDCSNKSNQQIKIKYDDKKTRTKCKSCSKNSKQTINSLISKFPNTYHLTQGNIKKFLLLLKKVFILMNIWMIGINLMIQIYLQ